MFWKYGLAAASPIHDLLDKEDITLSEILNQDDVLQECRSRNDKLIAFFSRPPILEALVRVVVEEPPDELDEKTRFKHNSIAAEILSSDIMELLEPIGNQEPLLSMMMNFVETESPLNPLMASFFSKSLGILIARKTDKVLERMRSRVSFLPHLVRHLGTSAVMDLVLRLLSGVDGDLRHPVTDWLMQQGLLLQLCSLFSPGSDPDRASNASQLLCHLIESNRNKFLQDTKARGGVSPTKENSSGTDPMEANLRLLDEIESSKFAETLLTHMFSSSSTSSTPAADGEQKGGEGVAMQEDVSSPVPSSGEGDSPITTPPVPPPAASRPSPSSEWVRDGRSDVPMVSGISVILALLTPKVLEEPPSFYGLGDEPGFGENNGKEQEPLRYDPLRSSAAVQSLLPHLPFFHRLLRDPPKSPVMETTHGKLEPPFGKTRLFVARLFATLVWRHEEELDREIARLGTLNVLLDLFFEYEWNNFLHTQVESLVFLILKPPSPLFPATQDTTFTLDGKELVSTPPKSLTPDTPAEDSSCPPPCLPVPPPPPPSACKEPLFRQLFEECRLIERIVEIWKKHETRKESSDTRRAGYMGHLTKMACEVSSLVPPQPPTPPPCPRPEGGEDAEGEEKAAEEEDPRTIFLRSHLLTLPEEVRGGWALLSSSTLPSIIGRRFTVTAQQAIASRHSNNDGNISGVSFAAVSALAQSPYLQQAMIGFRRAASSFTEENFTVETNEDGGLRIVSDRDRLEQFEQQMSMRPMHTDLSELMVGGREDDDEDEPEEEDEEDDKVGADLWDQSMMAMLGRQRLGAAREEDDEKESSPRLVNREEVPMEVDSGDPLPTPYPTSSSPPSSSSPMDTSRSPEEEATPSSVPSPPPSNPFSVTNPFVAMLQSSKGKEEPGGGEAPVEGGAPDSWEERLAHFDSIPDSASPPPLLPPSTTPPASSSDPLPPSSLPASASKYLVLESATSTPLGQGDSSGKEAGSSTPDVSSGESTPPPPQLVSGEESGAEKETTSSSLSPAIPQAEESSEATPPPPGNTPTL